MPLLYRPPPYWPAEFREMVHAMRLRVTLQMNGKIVQAATLAPGRVSADGAVGQFRLGPSLNRPPPYCGRVPLTVQAIDSRVKLARPPPGPSAEFPLTVQSSGSRGRSCTGRHRAPAELPLKVQLSGAAAPVTERDLRLIRPAAWPPESPLMKQPVSGAMPALYRPPPGMGRVAAEVAFGQGRSRCRH